MKSQNTFSLVVLSLAMSTILAVGCNSDSSKRGSIKNREKRGASDDQAKADTNDKTTQTNKDAECKLQEATSKVLDPKEVDESAKDLIEGSKISFDELADGTYSLKVIATDTVYANKNYRVVNQLTLDKQFRVDEPEVVVSAKDAPKDLAKDPLRQIPIELEFTVSNNEIENDSLKTSILNTQLNFEKNAVSNCFGEEKSANGIISELQSDMSQHTKASDMMGKDTELRLLRSKDGKVITAYAEVENKETHTLRRLIMIYQLTAAPSSTTAPAPAPTPAPINDPTPSADESTKTPPAIPQSNSTKSTQDNLGNTDGNINNGNVESAKELENGTSGSQKQEDESLKDDHNNSGLDDAKAAASVTN